ncbi:MAG TPA: hypothetical protein VJI66_01250 [Candidatus Paceibacterota bacterium]
MEDNNGGVRTWQWVVTVIVIIILIVLGYYLFRGDKVVSPTTDDTNTTDDSSLVASQAANRVVVTDQFPGNIVYLSSVQLEKPGFVVVHKDNNGTPGDIIGYQYFDKGINPGRITLTSSTVEGGVYYAMLHSDDGDKVFNATKDLPLKDSKGDVIMKIFRATSDVSAESKG